MKHAYRPLPVEVYKLKSRSFYGEIRDRLEIEYFLLHAPPPSFGALDGIGYASPPCLGKLKYTRCRVM